MPGPGGESCGYCREKKNTQKGYTVISYVGQFWFLRWFSTRSFAKVKTPELQNSACTFRPIFTSSGPGAVTWPFLSSKSGQVSEELRAHLPLSSQHVRTRSYFWQAAGKSAPFPPLLAFSLYMHATLHQQAGRRLGRTCAAEPQRHAAEAWFAPRYWTKIKRYCRGHFIAPHRWEEISFQSQQQVPSLSLEQVQCKQEQLHLSRPYFWAFLCHAPMGLPQDTKQKFSRSQSALVCAKREAASMTQVSWDTDAFPNPNFFLEKSPPAM